MKCRICTNYGVIEIIMGLWRSGERYPIMGLIMIIYMKYSKIVINGVVGLISIPKNVKLSN